MFRKPPLPTPSSATYVRLPAAPRPRPATPRAAESEAAVAAAATAVSSSFSGCAVIRSCEPSTGGDRASSTVLGFPAGRSRAAGRADSEAAGPSALGRPAGAAPHFPACGAPGLAGAAAARPSPPLPRAPRPGLLACPPACATLARLFRGSRGLAHGGRHLFRPGRPRGFIDVGIRVKPAAKRNFQRRPYRLHSESGAMRLGRPGAAARPAAPFPAVGNLF